MCLTSPFKIVHVLDLAGAVNERCLGWGGVGGGVKGQCLGAPTCTYTLEHDIHHSFQSLITSNGGTRLRPEAMWTHQSIGCPNGWVAVLIFVMNLYVNILGENGNRQEMEGTGRSHPGVSCIFW